MPEARLEDRFQKMLDRALHDAIGDSRNAQGSEFPFAWLGNPFPATRTGRPSATQLVAKPIKKDLAP
jgi:hypothetical protein